MSLLRLRSALATLATASLVLFHAAGQDLHAAPPNYGSEHYAPMGTGPQPRMDTAPQPYMNTVPQAHTSPSQDAPMGSFLPMDPVASNMGGAYDVAQHAADVINTDYASQPDSRSIQVLACSCNCPTDYCNPDCGCHAQCQCCSSAPCACQQTDCTSCGGSDACNSCDKCDTCDSCDLCSKPCSCWYLQADALIVTRNNASINQPVVLTDAPGNTVLSTHDLDFDWTGGPRLFLGHKCGCDNGWEVGYFGVFGGLASNQAADPNNLDIPGPLVAVANDFDNADVMTLTWSWYVNNAEANWVHGGENAQFLAGFRYFNLDEKFNIRAQDNDGDVSDYHLSTSNNLFGAQIGGRLRRESGAFGYGIVGKAGVYGNDAIERQIVRDNNNTFVLRDARGRTTTTSFVGDLDLYASARLSDHWRLRGGYYLLWVTQVALAPDQLDFSFDALSGTTVHDTGSLFMHGATAGLEATW